MLSLDASAIIIEALTVKSTLNMKKTHVFLRVVEKIMYEKNQNFFIKIFIINNIYYDLHWFLHYYYIKLILLYQIKLRL